MVVKNEDKKRKLRSDRYRPVQQQGQQYQQPRAQQYQQPRPQQYQSQGASSQNMAQMQNDMTRKQQELKQRLQQRYGSQQSATQRYGGQPGDILSRANANVRENDEDILERSQMSENNTVEIMGTQGLMESDLMREINDLIVKGYESDLSFERDFVSEGIEMLNAYELQTEV